jgi:Zn-dependent peptidase ImmA (M78 family)
VTLTGLDSDVLAISDRVRREFGLARPPVNAASLLRAHQLSLPEQTLESVLLDLGLDPQITKKLDAALDIGSGCVFVRDGMHDRQKNWGYMHELGHYVIPWHRDLLYHCSILRLPKALQNRLEREADEFASNMFFFGSRFVEEAASLPFGLSAPLSLSATYDVSVHAAFWRYAEENPGSCCLLVSEPVPDKDGISSALRLSYYIKSRKFRCHIPPGQTLPPTSDLARLFNDGSLNDCLEHEVRLNDDDRSVTYRANSFSNGYSVFTLIWMPATHVA